MNCRSNHLHIVVAADLSPDRIRDQFKAWCSRRLNELAYRRHGDKMKLRRRWWAERASMCFFIDEAGLQAAVTYVLEAQDHS